MAFLLNLKFNYYSLFIFLVVFFAILLPLSQLNAEGLLVEKLKLTEIMYDPEGNNSDSSKWLEFFNLGDGYTFATSRYRDLYKLDDFYLCEPKSDDSCNKRLIYSEAPDPEISSDDFIIIATDTEKFSDKNDFSGLILKCSTMTISSSNNKSIGLCYKDDEHCNLIKYSDYYDKKTEGHTLEKIDFNKDDKKDNWQESYVLGGTPGEKSSQKPEEKGARSKKITINEILPNPKNEDDEFIEIYNPEDFEVNIGDWVLRDSSKTGKYVFAENTLIESGGFLFIKKDEFKFSLNNTGETLYLLDKNENEISKVDYESAKENISYNFNGKKWRWSSFLTPGEENIFEDGPDFSIKYDKDIFANIYAQFSVKVKNDKDVKYRWDFGDGHKSYKKNPKHKYEKSGKYKLTLKISTKIEDIKKEATIKVEKFQKEKVEIVALMPNPKGKDTNNEWIEIKNSSKKKINLKDWSIATGTKKKLTNHLIKKDFIIPPGKTKKLTRKNCAFSLNNSAMKMELRSPDKKTVQKIKYGRKNDKIKDNETYQKDGKDWKWIVPVEEVENEKDIPDTKNVLGAMDVKMDLFESFKNNNPLNLDFWSYITLLVDKNVNL